ncbi:MAG: dephospho-CoA kinase [Gammaproteobacteria bacterium]
MNDVPPSTWFRVALTGGIASGKSTVAARFAELGAVVIDTDMLAREVVARESDGLRAVVAAFGAEILRSDGTLDRVKMRHRIFDNSEEKQKLESILHPRIGALLAQRSNDGGGPYQIFEIPLYAETGGRIPVDRVLVVDCDPDAQITRVMARDNIERAHAQSILAQQASREKRLSFAHDVIVNDTDVQALNDAVYALHRRYLDIANAWPTRNTF